MVDPGLQRDIRTLAHYNVARGYGDGTYHPTDNVIYTASISLISRAIIAHGYWQPQNTGSCPGVPTDHCQDVMTYSYYTAGVGGAPSVPDWNAAAPRGWLAEAEWRALNSYFSVDRVP